MKILSPILLLTAFIISYSGINAQPVTGVWRGKIDHRKVEVKIIKNGDSLTGTSYYYESANSYRRYSIKGYYNDADNSVVWWDDQLIEAKGGKGIFSTASPVPYVSTADYNCPGGTKMYLNGNASLKENEQPRGPVDLEKISSPFFKDEWDEVIENYTSGANDPRLIDSIGKLAFIKPKPTEEKVITEKPAAKKTVVVTPEKKYPETVTVQPQKKIVAPPEKKKPGNIPVTAPSNVPVITNKPVSIDEKFASRDKVILKEVPVSGDSIELRFYDNAEVDGDSISIFLNGHIIYEHIRLTEKPYIVKLAVAELQETNDLVMVAENLGSIPPNTAYLLFFVDGKRYDARLESTEQTSAGVRFIRTKAAPQSTKTE